MLNIVLRNKIPHWDVRILYDCKNRLSSSALRNEVRKYIKEIRREHNGSKAKGDPLLAKLKKYNNKGGWMASESKKLDQRVYDDKKPIPNDFLGQLRSIEFELVFKNQKCQEEFARDVRRKMLTKWVTIKEDGSLRRNEDDGHGICREVVLTYKSGDEKFVYDLCEAFRKRAYVNNSCGTHVHFDMRNVDEKTVAQYGKRVVRCLPVLRALLPKQRRNNKHCATDINDFRGQGRMEDRYSFVNLQAYTKYKTIEIRGHSGTLNAEKILHWIKLCERIMSSRIRARTEDGKISDPGELIKMYKLDDNLTKYVQERYKKFNSADFEMPKMNEIPIPHAPDDLAGADDLF